MENELELDSENRENFNMDVSSFLKPRPKKMTLKGSRSMINRLPSPLDAKNSFDFKISELGSSDIGGNSPINNARPNEFIKHEPNTIKVEKPDQDIQIVEKSFDEQTFNKK